MTVSDLMMVYAAYVIAVASPGPSNMAIMNASMRYGRRSGLSLAAGVVTMSVVWGTIAATGVSAVLTTYANAITILKVAGGLYLLWLALKAARSAARHDIKLGQTAVAAPNGWTFYRSGLLMHVGNPKAVFAWLAIMSLGLRPDATPATVAVALIGCIILGVIIFCGYALLFSTAPMARVYARARRWFEGVLAVFFAVAGIRLLFSR
ncbi:threonine/homoserine/homoserine lactone efflux protein [Pseudorhizobium tarimense]|uniref:Threonine/homoserine/homoserine lactone efflux protein n=1 Tax=Pseudorhizobium tarimense TaxID=1079109 RepID=A0ABV2H441_9HYPH|nr:LysE family translocator [Pseudorhizobium tarimense]MCJ8518284.1 LysE family translocator [Pseudorhizobium tarimense]